MCHRLPTAHAVPFEVDLLLRGQQRRLANYELHTLDIEPSIDLHPLRHELEHVTDIQLFLESMGDCPRAFAVLTAAPSILKLQIKLSSRMQLSRSAALRFVFGMSEDSNNSAVKLKLQSLQLRAFNLQNTTEILLAAIDTAQMAELRLDYCSSTSTLLSKLATQKHQLKRVQNYRHGRDEHWITDKVESFLKSCSGLKELRVSTGQLAPDEGFGWKVLQSHGASLKILYFDDFDMEDDPFWPHADRTMPDFLQLCKACSGLEQLAIVCPSLKKGQWQQPDGLEAFLVSRKPRLHRTIGGTLCNEYTCDATIMLCLQRDLCSKTGARDLRCQSRHRSYCMI